MFITTHAAMGALVGELFPTHPVLAFVLSMALHFVVDTIPHGDTDLYKGYISGSKVKRAIAITVVDAVTAVLLVAAFFTWRNVGSREAVAFGIAGGVLPDLLVGIYETTRVRWLRWFHRFHFFFHNFITSRYKDFSHPVGVTMELSLLAALIFKLN